MKKILFVISCLSIFFMVGCTQSNTDGQVTDGTNVDDQSVLDDDLDDDLEDTEQSKVLEMINEFRDSLILLGATSTEPNLYKPSFLSNVSYSMITKEDVIEMPNNASMDTEWLDMSMMVLHFSELLVNAQYTLGKETLLSDTQIDTSIWGWEITVETSVILKEIEEVLYLRVISEQTIRTFYFSYDENDYINILRIDEAGTLYDKNIYIEDFTEQTGLSIWSTNFLGEPISNYQVYTTYHVNDNALIVLSINTDGEVLFAMGTYTIGDVEITISPEENGIFVQYDLANMDNYDQFDLEGNLYLDGELVPSPLEVYAGPYYVDNVKNYVIYGRKIINSEEDSLAITEWGLNSDISYLDIIADIELAKTNYSITGVQYDYTNDITTIIGLLQDELYFDYSDVLE